LAGSYQRLIAAHERYCGRTLCMPSAVLILRPGREASRP
jgi:hypothetical protein